MPSASVIEVARRHDVHPNLLTVWRRQARTGAFEPAPALRQEDAVQFAAVSVRRSSRHGRPVQELAGRSRLPLQAECSFGSRAQSIPRR